MSKFDKRMQAERLRRFGKSIGDIAKRLEVSKSSVSIWCRDLELSDKQKEVMRLKAIESGTTGRLMGAEVNRQKRLSSLAEAKLFAQKKISKISTNELFISGLCLYWAEGSKSSNSKLTFTNSDSTMILFIVKWLKENFNVKPEDIIPRISINIIHQPRQGKIINYWSKILNLPKSQFRKIIYINTKLNKVYANYENYFGILSIRIHKSTTMWYKILACIDRIKSLPM